MDRSGHIKARVTTVHWGVLGALALTGLLVAPLPAQQSTPHAYFENLISRSDLWRAYSLRPRVGEPISSPYYERQLAKPSDGGYAAGNRALMVTYAPDTDGDPRAQDAAKVVIPPFGVEPGAKLASSISSSALSIALSDLAGDVTKVTTELNAKGRQIKIDDEIMITDLVNTPLNRTTGIVTLSQRGAFGTTATSHAANAGVRLASNSLSNQVRLPIESHDRATWLVTWDGYFTDSFLRNGIGNYKTFQLASDGIWLEPQTHFDGAPLSRPPFNPDIHVASTGRMRSYNIINGPAEYAASTGNQTGPGVTNINPIEPTAAPYFLLHPNRWTRWWILIDQRADDYDRMDAWVADEQTGPVQIYSQIPLSVRNGQIDEFYLEFNTSTALLPAGRTTDFRDLVAYVRNVVVLRNPLGVSNLLMRPGAGTVLPRPAAPRNLKLSGAD